MMSPATNPGPGFSLSSSPSNSRPTALRSRPSSSSLSLNPFLLSPLLHSFDNFTAFIRHQIVVVYCRFF
ncbi:hypothetical protein COP2_014594 [Malus domestica]